MPLVLQIMDDLAGRPVSSTYLDLWCRKWDEQFLIMNKPPKEYAFFAGFSGQRGEQTWKERMRQLVKLGFIEAEAGPHGDLSYVLIVNPMKIIEGHVEKKTRPLWDIKTERELITFPERAMARFSPDGTLMACRPIR
jgi:hypothetical protein